MEAVFYIFAYLIAVAACFGAGIMTFSFTGLGGLIFVILFILLVGLKVAGAIAWSWWWVLLPIWAAFGSAVVGQVRWELGRDHDF